VDLEIGLRLRRAVTDALLAALERDELFRQIGRIFLRGHLVVCGHPACDAKEELELPLTGHYYGYAQTDLRRQARNAYLVYEDHLAAGSCTIDREPATGLLQLGQRGLLFTTREGLAAIQEHVGDAMVNDLILELDDAGCYELFPGFELNGDRAQVLTIKSDEAYRPYWIRAVRNGRICGVKIVCGLPLTENGQ
jgi:hypothetical protein